MPVFKTSCLALLMLCGVPTWAQWSEFTKARNGDVYLIEQSSIQRVGDTARVWVLVNHPRAVTNPPPYSYSAVHSYRALMLFDCKGLRARRLEASFFSQPSAEGRLMGTFDTDDWYNVPPETPDNELMKSACEQPPTDQSGAPPAAATAAPTAPRAPAR